MKFRSVLACLLAVLLILSGCGSSEDIIYYSYEDFVEEHTLSDYVTLGDYKGLKIDPADIEVSEEALTDRLHKKMQESSYVTYEEDIKEGTVQKGDTCAIDYIGKKDGVAFEGGTGSYDLEIGSGSFIPGFEEGLIGKKIGSTVDLNLTFPENYGNEELNGQDVVFTVTIKKVTTRKVYKELTDELAATMDKTVKTADEYMTKLETEIADEMDDELRLNLWNTVVEKATFSEDLPEEIKDLSQATFNAFYYNAATQAGYDSLSDYLAAQGASEEVYQKSVDAYTLQQTKHYLAALAVCEAIGYELPEAEFEQEVASATAAAGYEDSEAYLESMGGDLHLYLQLYYQHALDYVRENAVEP